MDTLRLVDPELRALLESFPTAPLTLETLPLSRARTFDFAGAEEPAHVERRVVPGPPGAPDVALQVYRPIAPTGEVGCVYHIHGGGYVSGAAPDMEPLHRALCAHLGCVVVSVDYRLAPETVFPGAVEDCYAGLTWVAGRPGALGVDPRRIGVMGESAGGGLAAALALLARDRGEHRLSFQHLIYPMIDDRTCTLADPHPTTGEFVWTAQKNRFGWGCLLGHEPGVGDVSPYAAAARAENLSGLPPTYISAAALDLFLEENLEYARRLTRAGTPVELHVYPGAYHGFELAADAAVTRQARRDSLEALARALARPLA
jgi:triacylglycerol lipase